MEDGIWSSRNQSRISYPEAGNKVCFQVEDNSFWFNHRNDCILKVLSAYPSGGVLFDVGGGNGYVSQALKKSGIDTVMLEPGKTGVANVKVRGVHPIIHSTFQVAGFKQHVIPSVGLFDVLEHIQEDVVFLGTIRDHLQPSGRLYLTVPAYQWLWSVVDDDSGHYRRYTIRSLSGVLSQAGFEVEFASYFFAAMVAPILLFRHIPSRLGLRKSREIEGYAEEISPSTISMNRLMTWMLRPELKVLGKKKTLRLGGSCILVARPKPAG
jgi:2-polyprenyl-3-methyl-5-hydroxy-6-metoxy-1,4-benzoquinol methylase